MTKVCEKCGSTSFSSNGYRGNKQRLVCKGCGRWTTGPIPEITIKDVPEANTPIEPITSSILKKIGEKFTSLELQAIANGGRLLPGMAKVPIVSFSGTHIKIGAITDTHIGSKYFKRERLIQAFDEFKKEGVNFVTHSGDVTEGMSNRPGHIYELDQLGYNDQRQEAINILGYWKGKMYLIDGNHDRWFIKSNGALIVQDIANRLPDAEFLGHDEGNISLNGFATLKLWHGEDGSCFDDKTEIQTLSGWKLFSDITENDFIATMTKDRHVFEWQQPTNIFIQDYDGDMIHFKSRTVDSMVTPNHGMWVRASNSATYKRKK